MHVADALDHRPHATVAVTVARVLDLDDVGPEIDQQVAGEGARQVGGEVGDPGSPFVRGCHIATLRRRSIGEARIPTIDTHQSQESGAMEDTVTTTILRMKLESFALEPGLVDEVDRFMARHPVADLPHDLEARFAALVAFERALHEAGLAVVAWPEHLGGRGPERGRRRAGGVRAGCPLGAGARQLRRHRGGRCPHCSPMPPRSSSSGGCHRWRRPTTCGASSSASLTPARTWRRSPPGRRATATAGW